MQCSRMRDTDELRRCAKAAQQFTATLRCAVAAVIDMVEVVFIMLSILLTLHVR